MARFHPLTVTGLRKTIRDAVEVTLTPDDPSAFGFTQGQYLTFRREFDGQELRRNYSICSAVGAPLTVGIKRVEGGVFSTWANTELAVGDRLEAMAPQGRFFLPLDPGAERHYLAFAGGSGITPILSILRTTLAAEPGARFTLVYANRAVNTIMFREELEDLKNSYMGRLTLLHVLEADAQEIDLFTGRVTEARCGELIRAGWVPVADAAFICGPEPMMLGIAKALGDAGMAKEAIKYELFSSPQQGRAKAPAAASASEAAETQLAITLDGATQMVAAPRSVSLLEAARANQIDAPFACQAGVCASCRCRVTAGEVEMVANHALEDDEVAKGYVLSCQAYPTTDHVAFDYDQ